MNKNTAKSIVAEETKWYTPVAFEFDGQWYVLATPLSDYDPKKDVSQTWVRVDDNGSIESMPGLALVLADMDHPGLCDAAKLALEEF